ncbi:N-acetylmuramoyl-L-alanine amidase [Gordonia alkaliphila]
MAALPSCATSNDSAAGSSVVTQVVTEMVPGTPTTTSQAAEVGCTAPVIAIDPGHNPTPIDMYDPKTGAYMSDYSNGAEDADTMEVSRRLREDLVADGYTVVLLKKGVNESVSYRDRVTRAEKANADLAISVHTYTDDHRIFVQRVGLSRQGTGADGQPHQVTYTNRATAAESQKLAADFAAARGKVEGRTVEITDNSFDGRPPLWAGSIPIIALISDKVPWIYNEFGTPTGGGSVPIGEQGIATYAQSLAAGVRAAVPNKCKS